MQLSAHMSLVIDDNSCPDRNIIYIIMHSIVLDTTDYHSSLDDLVRNAKKGSLCDL